MVKVILLRSKSLISQSLGGDLSPTPPRRLVPQGCWPARRQLEPKTRRMCRKSRVGRASGVILGVLALFFGTFRFRRAYPMHSELHVGTFQTPKTVLPSRREHRFQKITVSANYLDLTFKITSQTDLQDASMALKTRPKRSQTHLESLFGGLRGSLRTLLGAPRRCGAIKALQKVNSGSTF